MTDHDLSTELRVAAAVELAFELQDQVAGRDGGTVMLAYCWVLAQLVIQAETERGIPAALSFDFIRGYLQNCVDTLRPSAPGVH